MLGAGNANREPLVGLLNYQRKEKASQVTARNEFSAVLIRVVFALPLFHSRPSSKKKKVPGTTSELEDGGIGEAEALASCLRYQA